MLFIMIAIQEESGSKFKSKSDAEAGSDWQTRKNPQAATDELFIYRTLNQ